MKTSKTLAALGLALAITSGCTLGDTAQVSALVGRTIGAPLGAVATAIEESVLTAGDVTRLNPRYQNAQAMSPNHLQPPLQPSRPYETTSSPETPYYYRAEVLIKTRGPARIESLQLQDTQDVSEFWR